MNTTNFLVHMASEPQFRVSADGKEFGSCSIAKRHGFKRADGTQAVSFFNANFGSGVAKSMHYLTKGSPVVLSGEFMQKEIQNQQGNKENFIYFQIGEVEFAETKAEGEARRARYAAQAQSVAPAQPVAQAQPAYQAPAYQAPAQAPVPQVVQPQMFGVAQAPTAPAFNQAIVTPAFEGSESGLPFA